jgi:hypothetical protein
MQLLQPRQVNPVILHAKASEEAPA